MKLRTPFCISMALAILFAGCSLQTPKPVESEYLRTTVGGFIIDRRTRTAQYSMRYDVLRTITEPLSLKVEFQNPVNASQPLRVEAMLLPGQSKLSLESEALPGIQNRGIYNVAIVAYDMESNTEVFRHIQGVQFIAPPGL